MTVSAAVTKPMTVKVRLDGFGGRVIAELDLDEGSSTLNAPLTAGIVGKHAVYFEFSGGGEAEFDCFTFDR